MQTRPSPPPVARGVIDATSVIDHLPVATMLVGLDDAVVACNAAAHALFGMPAAEAVGRRFNELEMSYRVPGLRATLERVKQSRAELRISEAVLPRATGDRFVTIILAPVSDAEGRTLGVLLVADDRTDAASLRAEHEAALHELQETNAVITEELQTTNEELRLANDELRLRVEQLEAAERADQQKNEFLAMLAHELRNPLAPIVSALYIIRQRASDDRQIRQAVEIADRQVRHQARLLDDLLDVSRIVLGKVELRVEPVDFVQVARQAADAARILIQTRAHEFAATLPEAPLVVNGDATRLEQVVRNLLTNAIKYTNPGGRIELSVAREGGSAVLRVKDSGVGIPPELLPKIFDLFMQADSSLARSQGGLGIGLTLVRRLVEMHGGTVTARSEGPGRGSEFTMRLPVVEPAAPRSTPGPAPVAATSRRVLIIEDSGDARALLRVVLEMDGHVVNETGDGAAGITLAVEWAPEIVLVDIGLSGVDGYEVARQIRKRLGARVKLIALTGYGGDEARRHSAAAGFDLHLVKPVGPEELAQVLASA